MSLKPLPLIAELWNHPDMFSLVHCCTLRYSTMSLCYQHRNPNINTDVIWLEGPTMSSSTHSQMSDVLETLCHSFENQIHLGIRIWLETGAGLHQVVGRLLDGRQRLWHLRLHLQVLGRVDRVSPNPGYVILWWRGRNNTKHDDMFASSHLTRLATALLTACTGVCRSGIELPSSPSSCRMINLLT